MKRNLFFLPIPICIIVFAIFAYLEGAWMFFSSLIATIGVLSLIGIESDFIDFPENQKMIDIYKTGGVKSLKRAVQTNHICYAVCNAICLILSFFPFAFMSKSFSRFFHMWSPYEGGILVSIITILNIVISGYLLVGVLYHLIGFDKGVASIEKEIRREKTDKRRREESQRKINQLIESIAPTDKVTSIGTTLFAISTANNKVLIGKKIYNLSDIISFSIYDNSHQTFTPNTSDTKTGSMIGRAIVGGLIGGRAGAIIGGATAINETINGGGTSIIHHDYTVHLSMDSLSDSLLSIHIGSDYNEMEKAKALLNVIVKRNGHPTTEIMYDDYGDSDDDDEFDDDDV